MKVIDAKKIGVSDVSKDPLFLGGKVTTQSILEEDYKGDKIQIMMVKFAQGARNKLHTHTTQQILIVTEEKGIVATKDEAYIVTPGMVVYVSPGEAHWHGATQDSAFAHLSILGEPHKFNVVETR